MFRWNARDWISAILGWTAAFAVVVLVPSSIGPLKFAIIFEAGFCTTWVIRLLIPH